MTPFTTENGSGRLCQDVVSLAPPLGIGSDRAVEQADSSASSTVHDTCCTDEHAERVCGTELRLEEVLRRFRTEAKLGCFDNGRYRCRYYSWGSGPPLIFLHGLGDDAVCFVMPIARLSENFRCICYEQPKGEGDGARLGRYHHADLVADLLALVDHLNMPAANLFGSSFGSTISLAAMHQHPKRFPKAVLQGGFAKRPLAVGEIMLASWARYWPGKMHSLPLRQTVLLHTHYAPFAARQPELWQFFLERDGTVPMEAVARRALILNQIDLRPILPAIRQPILLICGDHDPLVGKDCEDVLLKGLPNATRAEIQGCGHMAQFTHAEILAEATRRFLV